MPLGYQSPRILVPLKYIKTNFTALKWNSLELDWNLEHKHTLDIIFDLLVIEKRSDIPQRLHLV